MRFGVVSTTALAVAICLGVANFSRGAAVVLPGGSSVEGKTIGQWTADWWNWAGSVQGNVFADPDGSLADENQSGPVWFVAGTQSGTHTRNFQVPGDKYVLFPLVNWVVANGADPGFASTAEEAEALTTGTIDPANLIANIDGEDVVDLASHRERSPVNFNFTVVEGSGVFGATGTFADANSDGYWLMLEPLGEGSHVLRFGGTTTDYTGPDPAITIPSFSVDVTANVTVPGAGPGPTPIPLPPAALAVLPVVAFAGAGRAIRFAKSRRRGRRLPRT